MKEHAQRIKCDVCGKATEWNEASRVAEEDELKSWKTLNLRGTEWMEVKDYCSKECIIKDLEKIYNESA